MHPDDEPTVILPVVRIAGSRWRWPVGRTALAAVLAVVLLAGVSVLAWPLLFRPAAASTGGEVFLESTSEPGRDPFSGTTVVGNPPGTKSQTPAGASGGGIPTVAGNTPALYGGSRNERVCDRQKLITFLSQHPDKATAWADVLGIKTTEIADYIGTLTPLQLRADTRVTNHGFANGHATTLQSVLQAGTAVLADDMGRPRVKCGCGNPLLDPVATPIAPQYTGTPWPDFRPSGVSAVSAGSARVDRFVVYDIPTGETFYRLRGTDGDADTPTTPPAPVLTTAPPPPPPAPTVKPPPAPTVKTCPHGRHLSNGVCVLDPPIACPHDQTRVSGQCVPTPLTCPAGTHPSPDGTSCDPDTPSCPDGTHLSGDGTTCIEDPPSPRQPPPTCPEGTHRVEGTCVDNTPTTVTCKPGYHPVSDGTACEKDVAPTTTTEQGEQPPPEQVPTQPKNGGYRLPCLLPDGSQGEINNSTGECGPLQ